MSTLVPRSRSRAQQPPQQPVENQSVADDWWKEGDDGFQTAERMNQGKKPFASRFYLKVDESADIVLLDDTNGFFIHEYEIYDQARKKMFYETVRKDTDYDPLEQLVGVDTRFKDASYVMYLTCIDLREFTDRNGNQRYFAKKLLPVKRVQMKKFKRYLEQYGSYRGLMLRMVRDDNKSAKIGDPEINVIDGKSVLTEEDLIENFGGPAVLGQDGKTIVKQENADCFPFDYRTILAPSPSDELARRWGAPQNPGSSAANSQMMSQGSSRVAPQRTAATPPPISRRASPAQHVDSSSSADGDVDSTVEDKPSTVVRRAGTQQTTKTLVTKPAAAPAAEDDIPFDTDDNQEDWYEDNE